MTPHQLIKLLAIALILTVSSTISAQTSKKYRFVNGEWVEYVENDILNESPEVSGILEPDTTIDVSAQAFPPYFFLPAVFDSYDLHLTPDSIGHRVPEGPLNWTANRLLLERRMRQIKQVAMINDPASIRYNINTLPEAPKQYRAVVDPSQAKITIEEIIPDAAEVAAEVKPAEVRRIYWLKDFNGLIQFSQAYISPNWYQGGNNNLNMIINAIYNVKLNPAFNPNLLFENTISYKLAVNSAPDDSLRNYSISEDLFQVNSKFGVKAAKRWYYSASLQFKTQFLNNYVSNTRNLTAAFLSPGELTIGLGMTYSYNSPSQKFSVNASIAPLSYNLKICTNKRINETALGIKAGHTTASQYGSNIDCTLKWKIAYNIDYSSRLTAFTNYSYIQADWEHTLSFTVNRFLSTQLYVHMRYDTSTPAVEDSRWHKLQLKEILSFGFAYKFSTI